MRPRATSERTSSGARLLAPRDVFHLLGDVALARIVHLRADRVVLAFCYPFFAHVADPSKFGWTKWLGLWVLGSDRPAPMNLFALLGLLDFLLAFIPAFCHIRIILANAGDEAWDECAAGKRRICGKTRRRPGGPPTRGERVFEATEV